MKVLKRNILRHEYKTSTKNISSLRKKELNYNYFHQVFFFFWWNSKADYIVVPLGTQDS